MTHKNIQAVYVGASSHASACWGKGEAHVRVCVLECCVGVTAYLHARTFICLCVCVRMCVCLSVCVCVCVRARARVSLCVHAGVRASVRACVSTSTQRVV